MEKTDRSRGVKTTAGNIRAAQERYIKKTGGLARSLNENNKGQVGEVERISGGLARAVL